MAGRVCVYQSTDTPRPGVTSQVIQEMNGPEVAADLLNAGLDFDQIASVIRRTVTDLMPAHNLYIALRDAGRQGTPLLLLAVEDDRRVSQPSHQAIMGLIDRVLQTGLPLLIQEDLAAAPREISPGLVGPLELPSLAVPILTEGKPLGVIVVQSGSASKGYTASHLKALSNIAAQTAPALLNATRYARASQALSLRVQELDAVLRTTGEAMLLLDADWRVMMASDALADLLSIAPASVIGKPLDAAPSGLDTPLITLIGYTPDKLRADCEALAQGRSTWNQTIVATSPHERHFERTLTLVHEPEAGSTGWLIVLRDLTEEREATRLMEEMTHMLVHDLRSPLAALMGTVDMLKTVVADVAGAEELLALADQSTNRMLLIIDALLDISRLESGQMPVHHQVVPIAPLLQNVAAQFMPLASAAQITLEVSAAPDLPSLWGDPELLVRVMNNLLDNAFKFTPDGGHIRLWAKADAETSPATALIGVTDSGPGIPPEEQGRLFKKFQQLAATTRGRRSGTGLGLPFCKLAVEAHGGQIWVESEAGKGATLVARLPVAE